MKACLVAAVAAGCRDAHVNSAPAGADGWLKGDGSQKFDTMAKHLRGFDMAMVETGYRYMELYWAGQDENWGYAAYQATKIRTAMENGLERRPKRAASAQTFLTVELPSLEEAIAQQNATLFHERFNSLTTACNVCHEMEQFEFARVRPPEHRATAVRLAAE